MDSPSDRHTVQVLSEDGKHVYTTIGAINTERLRPTSKTVFTFYETPAGQPMAVKRWYDPGDNFGQEFIYKKGRAVEISKTAHEEVRSEEAQNTPPAQTSPEPHPRPL